MSKKLACYTRQTRTASQQKYFYVLLALIVVRLCQMTLPVFATTAELKSLIRLDPDVVPQSYSINLTIDPRTDSFSGVVKINLKLKNKGKRIVLHANHLSFDKVNVQSGSSSQNPEITAISNEGTIALDLINSVGPGPVTLDFSYHAPLATGLEGLYKTVDHNNPAVFTQFEAIGARRAFPCFDEPGFKATFDVTLNVPKGNSAIANTLEISKSPSAAGFVTHHFATTKPLPTYLIAFAVGDFDVVEAKPIPQSDLRKYPIPLRGIAMRGNGEDLKIALDYTSKLVLAEEKYFRIAYPFDKLDIIAVPDFGAGGMENAGAITYDEAIVFLDEDSTLKRRRDFLSIHAHEISHHWFGNLASPRWWDDLWLNESFASFMEVKFAAMIEPEWRFDTDILANAHEAMVLDRASSVRQVHEPVDNVDGISAAFDAITYQKGAVLLSMVEQQLGEQGFQNFVHSFLANHAFGTMDTPDFLEALSNQPSGDKAASILSSFIYAPGIPLVKFEASGDSLQLTQSRFGVGAAQGKWQIPVCISGSNTNASECLVFGTTVKLIQGSQWQIGEVFPVDNFPRYYLFDISPDRWKKTIDATTTMPRNQALAVAINLDLAFFDGRVGLDVYLAGIEKIAKHPDWEVAGFPLSRMESLAAESASCPAIALLMQSKIKEIYGPRLKRIGLDRKLEGHDVETWLLELQREHLVDAFAAGPPDDLFHKQLAARGQALSKDPEEQLDDSDFARADVVGASLIAASIDGGTQFLETALARFKNTDDLHERSQWLNAIAASKAPNSSSIIEAMLLSKDLRNQEVQEMLFARAAIPAFREATWDMIERNSVALLARLDGDLEVSLIQIAGGFATQALAQRVVTTITPLLGKLRGGSVQLQQTLEAIHDNTKFLNRLETAAQCHKSSE